MSNLNVHNTHNLRLEMNYDEYWDFSLNTDDFSPYLFNQSELVTKCLMSYIDVGLYDCVFEDWINSLPNYVWDKAISSSRTLNNIGYTGFDNGLLNFRKDRILNSDFIKLYKDSHYKIPKETTLYLHKVNGSTLVYEYPLTVNDFDIKLNGGFYQGFFKTTCDDYQVLPSYLDSGDCWAYEFVLKKSNLDKESTKTLNDSHPNNKGIFFYIGTRAENKWIYLYDEDGNDKCFTLSPDDYVEDAHIDPKTYKLDSFLDVSLEMPVEWEAIALDDYIVNKYYDPNLYKQPNVFMGNYIDFDEDIKPNIIDENTPHIDMEWCCSANCPQKTNSAECKRYFTKCELFGDDYLDDDDIVDPDTDYVEPDIDISNFVYETDNDFIIGKNEEYFDTDNKFLLFDRTKDGFVIDTWKEGSVFRYVRERNNFNGNLFLLMNRTKDGYTVDTIDELRDKYKQEYDVDKDLYQNALAFRITDDGKIGYRYLIQNCDGNSKYTIIEGYSKPNIIQDDKWYTIHVKIKAMFSTMIIQFYVNGDLVFVSKEMPKLNLRALDDVYEKQETVPYNISIGGGTQGLCDTILPNYMIDPYRVYPLEEYFAGSFIGFFKSFKFYNCDLEPLDIKSNFNFENSK